MPNQSDLNHIVEEWLKLAERLAAEDQYAQDDPTLNMFRRQDEIEAPAALAIVQAINRNTERLGEVLLHLRLIALQTALPLGLDLEGLMECT